MEIKPIESLNFRNIFIKWFMTLVENKDHLNELDQIIGDGDHGSNMNRGSLKALAVLNDTDSNISDEELFRIVAFALLESVGGASGPLYGSAFLEFSQKVNEVESVGALIESGAQSIKKRGRAVDYEKTMYDMWASVASHLQKKSLSPELIENILNDIKAMKASKGRASYYGERTIGEQDPGAQSSAYLFEIILDDLLNR